jgi:hypothetical protein
MKKIDKLLIYHAPFFGWLKLINRAIYNKNNYEYLSGKLNELVNIKVVTTKQSQLHQTHAIRRAQHKMIGEYFMSFEDPQLIFEAVKEWSDYYVPRRIFKRLDKGVKKDNSIWGRNTGHGNSNRNTVRFPSKKRSVRVWANFYKLFPHLVPSESDYKVPVRKVII